MTDKNNKLNYCRICGLYSPDFFPWGETGDLPSYAICPCCGTEAGYEDTSLGEIRWVRHLWLQSGAKWREADLCPPGWFLNEQLSNIPIAYL